MGCEDFEKHCDWNGKHEHCVYESEGCRMHCHEESCHRGCGKELEMDMRNCEMDANCGQAKMMDMERWNQQCHNDCGAGRCWGECFRHDNQCMHHGGQDCGEMRDDCTKHCQIHHARPADACHMSCDMDRDECHEWMSQQCANDMPASVAVMDPHRQCDLGADYCHGHCHRNEQHEHCDRDHMYCMESHMQDNGPTMEDCNDGKHFCHVYTDMDGCRQDCWFQGEWMVNDPNRDLHERSCYTLCDMMDPHMNDMDHCHMHCNLHDVHCE